MRTLILLIVASSLLVALGQAAPTSAAVAPHHTYLARMDGDQEVPPVATDALGLAAFKVHRSGQFMLFAVLTTALPDVTGAHIHLAPAGSNGGVVVTLFDEPAGRMSFGLLSWGIITKDDLTGALAGMELSDLVAEMDADNAYVNVHTLTNPGGEIRGQISSWR